VLQVVDCRVCGDPNSVLRFAFVEFTDEGKVSMLLHELLFFTIPSLYWMHNSYIYEHPTDGASRALNLAGTMLGFYPVKVLPSKTAIIPVNPTFLPQVFSYFAIISTVCFCIAQTSNLVFCSLKMSEKCVQGRFIVPILTRR
jgi:hypothetical protein